MSSKEELELIIKLIKKYNLPMSPILEYAIQEQIEKVAHYNPVESFLEENVVVKSPVMEFTVAETTESINERFRNYLYANKSARTARNYYSLIDGHIRQFIKELINPNADSIYSFTTVDEVKMCILKLKDNRPFLEDNAKWHNAFTAALRSYLHFIESIS